ncbi:MAG: hypothetical protein ACRED4_08775 [Brevundimonas sp.]
MTVNQSCNIINYPPLELQLAEKDVRFLAEIGVPRAIAEIVERDALLALIPGGPDDNYNFGMAWVGGFDYEPEEVAWLAAAGRFSPPVCKAPM